MSPDLFFVVSFPFVFFFFFLETKGSHFLLLTQDSGMM